jgi:hypothetical protein
MNVQDALAAAESRLPGSAATGGNSDPRWGASSDGDLRDAVSTCLLEHLLEFHFDSFIARIEHGARTDAFFADTVCRCWKFGQSEDARRGARFDRLVASIRRRTD